MKRLFPFILMTLLIGSSAMAQTPADSSARVLGDAPRKHSKSQRNVLGAPVYYDTLGNIRGRATAADTFYVRPQHHFLNRLEDQFCHYFFEGQFQIGEYDLALGAMFTYLPSRWGFYGSMRYGMAHAYGSAGAALRLSDCGNNLDWHLYGGPVVGHGLGVECGIRLASTWDESRFCWSSFSMGVGYIEHHAFFTLGLSLTLMPSMIFIF